MSFLKFILTTLKGKQKFFNFMTKEKFNSEAHKRELIKLLLNVSKLLGGKIAFKGGTAAMMFYDLPRLSLDLDFDILDEINSQDIKDIESLLNKHGKILDMKNKKNTLFFLFSYEKEKPNIKLEFNKRIWENNNYVDEQLMGINIKIQDEKTALSNKMAALSNRKNPAPRDLFDIDYFLKLGFKPNKALIKERTSLGFNDFIKKTIKYINKNFKKNNVLQGLGELLDENQKVWAKEHLKEETIFNLKLLKDDE